MYIDLWNDKFKRATITNTKNEINNKIAELESETQRPDFDPAISNALLYLYKIKEISTNSL